MYVVTGATGITGRATVAALLARGERVRAVVHDGGRGRLLTGPNVEVVVADLADAAAVAATFAGARGVYLLRPPQPRSAGTAMAESFRQALAGSDIARVVVLSAVGAQHAAGNGVVGGLHDLEQVLQQGRRPVTFLRAASFLENWFSVMDAVRGAGVLPCLVPADLQMATVAAADIGTAVADLLIDGDGGHEVVGLDGPRTYSANDVAAVIGARLGRPVRAVAVPVAAQQAQLESAGVPAAYAVEVVQLYRGIADGTVAHAAGETIRRGTTTLEQWVAANVDREAT